MVAELKTRARTQSYNVGYKDTLQLYNMIAKNPDKYIREAENLLARDLNGGVMKCPVGEVTLAETFTAMDFFIEHHNEWICTELPDYKTSKYLSLLKTPKSQLSSPLEISTKVLLQNFLD